VPSSAPQAKSGRTSSRYFATQASARVPSFRANTVDARSVYVAISRARIGAVVYTDSRTNLTEALGIRDGAQVGAIDETMKVPDVATATPAPVRVVGMAIDE
jgi:hypothetical protein